MSEAFVAKYAALLKRAAEVLGNRRFAERWMVEPAIGLDGQRPIDLLSSVAGIELLETFLTRLEYCVYH
ncbi:putative toxin-antitoxin system antitoxin component [compost metagenome]